MISMDDVDRMVRKMHDEGWVHTKRGYKLNEVTVACAATHTFEELAEFQAACLAFEFQKKDDRQRGPHMSRLEESSDVLGCYLHQNLLVGLSLDEVIRYTYDKLPQVFVKQ